MVSTVDSGEEVVEKIWRSPRENKINKQALPKVFGNNHSAIVGIPEVIDYYNHKMKGVDMSDQQISNYWPLLQNHHYLIALFMHGLDIARINSFIVCKSQAKNHKANSRIKRSQKYFMTGWVEALKGQADAMNYGKMLWAAAMSLPSSLCGGPCNWMSNTIPNLPVKCFRGNIVKHKRIQYPTKKQQQCIYCRYQKMKDKIDGKESCQKVVDLVVHVVDMSAKCWQNVQMTSNFTDIFGHFFDINYLLS